MITTDNYLTELNNIKMRVFFDLLNLVGRVYVIVRYSEEVHLGNREFSDQEMENGLILVFNAKTNFTWKDDAIEAKLVFGAGPQKCYIPAEHVVAVYSPELNTQFVVTYRAGADGATPDESQKDSAAVKPESDNILRVDFQKKKK
jgi:stringent starvation protein B